MRAWLAVTCGVISTLVIAAHGARDDRCGFAAIPQHTPVEPSVLGAASISTAGRYVAFTSEASLLPADTDSSTDVYVLDVTTQAITIESLMPGSERRYFGASRPGISGDGRFVVFDALTAAGDPAPLRPNVVLRDRQLATSKVLSVQRGGAPGNGASSLAVISEDGRTVAFESAATNLVPGPDLNGAGRDVYVVSLETGEISRVSVDSAGRQRADGASFSPSISADGRHVAFTSSAALDDQPGSEPVRSDSARRPLVNQVFVRDIARGVTRPVSRARDGGKPNGASYHPSISADGRWVAFTSNARDIAQGVSGNLANIYIHDLETSETILVSRGAGENADGSSTLPMLSRDGRFLAFQSYASNLSCDRHCGPRDRDDNLVSDVFVFDRIRRSIQRVSADEDEGWQEPSAVAAVDATGRLVVFSSRHPIDPNDTRNDFDLFLWRACDESIR